MAMRFLGVPTLTSVTTFCHSCSSAISCVSIFSTTTIFSSKRGTIGSWGTCGRVNATERYSTVLPSFIWIRCIAPGSSAFTVRITTIIFVKTTVSISLRCPTMAMRCLGVPPLAFSAGYRLCYCSTISCVCIIITTTSFSSKRGTIGSWGHRGSRNATKRYIT